MFDFSIVTNWIHELLLSIMPEGLAIFIECVAVGVCLVALYAILAIILIYMERKVCGFFQCRLGPNRVGKWGSIQVVCDVLKMLTGNLHAERRRSFPLQPCSIYGNYRFIPHFRLHSFQQGSGNSEFQCRCILSAGCFQYRCGRYFARRMG